MASVAADLNVRGAGPGTTTSTVLHTPSNAAPESAAVTLDPVATSSIALSTDKDTKTFECIDTEPSFDTSVQCRSRALKRHQTPGSPWRLMAHRCAMLSTP